MKSLPLFPKSNVITLSLKVAGLALLLLLASPMSACSSPDSTLAIQNDSVTFARAQWTTYRYDGFLLRQHQFLSDSLFGGNQFISVIEVPPTSHRRLAFVTDTLLNTTSAMASRLNAYAAINGSFFDMSRGNPVCYLRIDGIECGINTPGKRDTGNRKYYQYATLVLRDGRPHLVVPGDGRHWERHLRDSNVMTAGPMLIHKGNCVPQRTDRGFVFRHHNRTALGIRPDGTVLLLTADGRLKGQARGLALTELVDIMRWLGCCEAINFDGGGSTTMYVRGAPDNGIVNYPSDNGIFNHEGERRVSNILILK